MKPTPKGWPRISSAVYYSDAGKAIDWLCSAFGFEIRLKVEGDGGRIEHSELVFGDDGLVMVATSGVKAKTGGNHRSPAEVGGANTQNMAIFVDDVDAHCARSRAAGAKITTEPKTSDYGEDYWTDRAYGCEDIEGHNWWFCQRLRSPKTA